MAKKTPYIQNDYDKRMSEWLKLSQAVPSAHADLGLNRRFNYIDPSSISMEEATTDPWKYKILDESGESPNDYSWTDHIADAFTDWKVKQNDTAIDTRRSDLLEYSKRKQDTELAIDYLNAVKRIEEVQNTYPQWYADEELQEEMASLYGIAQSTKPNYDAVSKSISGFNKLDRNAQSLKLNYNLSELDKNIDSTNKSIKEYQDANDYWQSKHKVSDWYKRKSEDADLSFTDPDTYLYGLAGLIGSSSSSWKTQLASAAIGIGAGVAAPFTGGTSLLAAAPAVFGLNYYAATEENKAELYQHYKDKVRQLSEADGSLQKVFEKNAERFGQTDLSDDQKLDLLLTGAIDNDDAKFNKNRLKAYEHLDDLYQDDMWAVTGDAVFDTALQLMPIGSIAKTTRLGKFGKKTKQFADKTAELSDKLSKKIDDIKYFGLEKSVQNLAAQTRRDYVFDIATRSMMSMGTEMMEESNQYLNGQKYMQDKYGDGQNHFESVWDNLTQGAKSLYSFLAPWDTALSSDEEWLKNARGGALLGGLMTGTVRAVGNARSTQKQMETDDFVSHLAMSDRLYEKDLLRKGKLYVDKALNNRESQLINSFDRLASMEGVDSELINSEKQRALRIMWQAKQEPIQQFAKDKLGIDPYSEDYKNLIALQDYYSQMYKDSKTEYDSKLKEYESAIAGMAQKGYLDQIVDDSDTAGYAERVAYVKNRIDALSRLEAYKQLKQQFEDHSADASELSKLGITVNKQDVDSFLETINKQIDYLNNQLNEQVSDYEGTPWVTAIDEYTKLYKDVAAYEINTVRAARELNLFDSKSPKIDEIKNRLKKMNEVYKADQKFEQKIQDDHTGYTEQQEQKAAESIQTKDEVKEQPAVQRSPEQSQGKSTEEPKVETVEEKTKELETPVVTQIIDKEQPVEKVETVSDTATDKDAETINKAIHDFGEAIVEGMKSLRKDVAIEFVKKNEKTFKRAASELQQQNKEVSVDSVVDHLLSESIDERLIDLFSRIREFDETISIINDYIQPKQQINTSELNDLRESIRSKRLENVDIEVKAERKSQRKLKKIREDLKKSGSTKEFTDEELKQQPSFKFEDNKYGKALTEVDTAVTTVYNTLIDDVVSQTTDQELARQAYYEGWVNESQLVDPNYSFAQDASIDDKAKSYLRDKVKRFKHSESKPYFMEQYLDNLEENDSNKEVLALYDEIKTSRDRLIEAIFNAEDTAIFDKYVEKINSNIVALNELLNSNESQQQSAEVRKKVVDYSRTADAQLDGIVGNTYEDNQAYILNSVKPDFITESKISFDIVDGDVHVIFNYKGQNINTKFKPSRNNEQLLDKLINYITQVKADPSKRIELIGLARTAGVYHEASTPMTLMESELWQGVDLLDINQSNVNIGITTGTNG